MHPGITLAIALSIFAIPVLSVNAITRPIQGKSLSATAKARVSTQRFSVTHPNHWMVTSRSDDFLIIFNQPPQSAGGEAPPYMIKTDVGFLPFSLAEAVQDSQEDMETTISRRVEEVTVNGRTGVRVWEESTGDFRNSVVTYIPVSGQETAYLVSFYNVQNRAAESAILQVHRSFELLR